MEGGGKKREGWKVEGRNMILVAPLSLSDRPTAQTALEYSWFKVRQ